MGKLSDASMTCKAHWCYNGSPGQVVVSCWRRSRARQGHIAGITRVFHQSHYLMFILMFVHNVALEINNVIRKRSGSPLAKVRAGSLTGKRIGGFSTGELENLGIEKVLVLPLSTQVSQQGAKSPTPTARGSWALDQIEQK